MAINDTTTNRGYQLPNAANLLAEDVVRLRAALNAIDGDVAARPTQTAVTAEITAAVNALVDAAPGALDTLNELAAALGDDAAFSTTVTQALAARLQLAGGTMTGPITLAGDPTAALHAAPKQYVDAQVASITPGASIGLAIALG